jgi:hypothetical protein
LVTSGGGSGGGTNAFTTAFASYSPAGNTSISGSIVPSGNISLSGLSAAAHVLSSQEMPNHSHQYSIPIYRCPPGSARYIQDTTQYRYNLADAQDQATGGGRGHTHNVSGNANFSGSNSPFSGNGALSGKATQQFAVKYADFLVATKN